MSEGIYKTEVFFSGHVQGVGFRYSTLQVAKEFEVSGMVRNLADGRVHLIAEGEEKEVKSFLTELDDRMGNFIRDREIKSSRGERGFQGFEIVR